MGQTELLVIEELAQGMTEAFAAVNDGFAAIEQAFNMPLEVDATGLAEYELTVIDMVRFTTFYVSGHPAALDFIIPDEVNGNTTYRRLAVINAGDDNITVKTETGGVEVIIPPNSARDVQVFGSGDGVYEVNKGSFTLENLQGITLGNDAFFTVGDDFIVQYGTGFDWTVGDNWAAAFGNIGSWVYGDDVAFSYGLRTIFAGFPFSVASYTFGAPANSQEMLRYVFAEKASFIDNWVTPGTGSVVFTAQPDDTDTVTIDDGINTPVVFEFDSGGGVTGGRTAVTIGAAFSDTATNLRTAINAAQLNVVAGGAAGTVSLTNNYGAGGQISATSAAPDFTVTDWSGGVSASRASLGVAPTATTTLTINQNGAPIGTIVFDTFGYPVFNTTGGATTFEPGDVLTIVNQASADATAANFGITLQGKRAA